MIVVRKLLATLLWWVIFFILVLVVMVAYVMFQIDLSTDQETANAAAEALGQDLGMRYGNLMIFGTLAVAFLGSLFGILPFSRHRPRRRIEGE